MNQSLQSMLCASLYLLEEARNSLQGRDMTLRIEQVFLVNGFDLGVHQVCRKNQFRFDQRENQAQYDDHRQRLEERPGDSADK